MNYLAHMFLSPGSEDIMIGNLSGDFVRVADLRFMKPEIEQGVLLHRKIDKFTDRHKIVDRSIDRLSGEHGKYAAVIVDILYDHLLTHNWMRYSDESLDDFKIRNYEILKRRHSDLPARLQKKIVKMIEKDFIEGYKSFEGMRFIMHYMDKRTSFPSSFEKSVDFYQVNFEEFNNDFNSFFPELKAYVESQMKKV